MDNKIFERWYEDGLITDTSHQKIKLAAASNLFSVHREIRVFLYAGVLLLSGGLGTLVYKNLDTIGHQFVLLFLALICAASFFYCIKSRSPFTNGKMVAPNSFFDYVLLLGCISFLSFVAYLQYQYQVFGNRYGAATFFPMVVLFTAAYYFDHLGVLSMAIASFAAWLGITITPLHILDSNNFNDGRIIYTGLFIGLVLITAGWITRKRNFKRHFAVTYFNFGVHLFLISCIATLFSFESFQLMWFGVLLSASYLFYREAVKEKSFYFLLIVAIYVYIGVSFMMLEFLISPAAGGVGALYLGFIYFIVSAIGMIYFLSRSNKKFRAL